MDSEPLPSYLRGYRRRLGLSQNRLAVRIGWKSGSSVSRHELLTRRPQLRTARRYARALGATVRELFAGSPHLLHGSPPALCVGPRVLSLDRTQRGFAYACLEGSAHLVEYGQVELGPGSTRRRRAEALLSRLQPDLLVLEERSRRTWSGIFTLATRWVTRTEVQNVFLATGTTKEWIADELVRRFPELQRKRPPRRRLWMSEDQRMNVLDAVSFALTALRIGDHRLGSQDRTRH